MIPVKLLLLIPIFLCCSPNFTKAQTADLIVIEKSARKLTLTSSGKQLAAYSVALGGTPFGPKQCRGDGKTPEGEYRIIGRNSRSAFHRSLKISYPNARDRRKAAFLRCDPGGDIMIHGLPNGRGWIGAAHRSSDWTLGCIALTDSEIDEIWKLVPNGANVRIIP